MDNMKGIFGEKSPTVIGVAMAVLGSSLVGISYTASKNAHNKVMRDLQNSNADEEQILNNTFDNVAAESILIEDDNGIDETTPLLEYSITNTMKHFEWWISILFLLLGEIFNFMAYGFAPTSVIAPLGTLSIISGAISGYFYLGERINLRNVLGMIISTCGSIIIVLFARPEEPKLSPEAIIDAICQLRFLIYLVASITLTTCLLILDNCKIPDIQKTFGDQYMVIRVSLTALFSGYTVLATKSISSLLTLTLYLMFTYWITYVLLIVLIVNGLLTVYYTNKALSTFDSTSVLPAEFAAFTFSAVLGSAMLYNDFDHATILDIFMFLIGCVITFVGVFLITTGQEKKGKPVNSRNSALISAPTINPPSSGDENDASSARPISSFGYFTMPGIRHSNIFTPHRLSQQGMAGFLTMLNALGNSRASYSFQQVVLPGRSNDVLVVPHSPRSHLIPPFNELHQNIDPNWGFEVMPTKTDTDEVAFFVRPISSRNNSMASFHSTQSHSQASSTFDITSKATDRQNSKRKKLAEKLRKKFSSRK